MNSVKMYANFIICHGFDNKIGSINEINIKEIDLYKSGIDLKKMDRFKID